MLAAEVVWGLIILEDIPRGPLHPVGHLVFRNGTHSVTAVAQYVSMLSSYAIKAEQAAACLSCWSVALTLMLSAPRCVLLCPDDLAGASCTCSSKSS